MQGKGVRVRFIVVLLVLFTAGAIFTLRPSLRTRGYFTFVKAYRTHWHHVQGRDIPARLSPIFEPYVPIWFPVEPGITMWLDPDDLVSNAILWDGRWEPGTWNALAQHLPPGATLVDVGAHIGWYSLKAAKAVGPTGHVIAVEPNPPTLATLRDNIRVNGYGGIIQVAPVAAYDSDATLTFYAAPRENTGESSLSLANASQDGHIAAAYQVHARPLDDIVREAGVTRVDAIKIDVEGAEFRVLKGSVDTLARYHPVVAVELLDPGLRAMGSSVDEVMAFMRAHGYVPKQKLEANMIFVPAAAP
jgi:FkbM family methyltransferase